MPLPPSTRYWRTRRNHALGSVAFSLVSSANSAYLATRTDGTLHVFLMVALVVAGVLAGWYAVGAVRYHFRYRARRALDRQLAPRVHVQTSDPFRTEV